MNTIKTLLIFLVLVAAVSCTEVMDIDLNEAPTQVVIEGNIASGQAPLIQITTSLGFNAPNDFPAVKGAVVSLEDSEGNIATLEEVADGIYTSGEITGMIGETYSLNVDVDNSLFSSVCEIPQIVKFDSILVEKDLEIFSFDSERDSVYEITVYFQDPPLEDNYYLFIEYRNGEQVASYTISDDYSDGLYLERQLYNTDRELELGDNLRIEMRCVTKEVYEYFHDLSSNNAMSATPTNPQSNIANAELGYFSAHTSESISEEITF